MAYKTCLALYCIRVNICSTTFFMKLTLFSKAVYWNPAKMSFQETFNINYYYYHYCYCTFVQYWQSQLTFKDITIFSHFWLTLTHCSPVLLIYTPWKHQKTFRFSDVFKGYRQAKPGCNGLKSVKNEKKS